jgi:hypothetical protein
LEHLTRLRGVAVEWGHNAHAHSASAVTAEVSRENTTSGKALRVASSVALLGSVAMVGPHCRAPSAPYHAVHRRETTELSPISPTIRS